MQASTAIDVAKMHVGETVPKKWCANFVSQVYKEAGFSSIFSASGYVPTLVAQFTGKSSTDVTTAQPGDLIVFGNNEHVMMYEGAGKVIGTATNGQTGISSVIETDWNNVYTDSGAKGPSLVLHTNLDNSAPTGDAGNKVLASVVDLKKYVGMTYGDLVKDPTIGAFFTTYVAATGVKSTDVFTANDVLGATLLYGQTGAVKAKYDVSTPWGALANSADDVATTIGKVATIMGKLTNPANWIHLGAMFFGVGIIGFGVWTVVKNADDSTPAAPSSPSMPIILKEGA